MKPPVGFSLCGSDTDFSTPVVGAFTKYGTPTYTTGLWGNGLVGVGGADSYPGDGFYFTNSRGAWSLSAWIKPNWNSNDGTNKMLFYDDEQRWYFSIVKGSSNLMEVQMDARSGSGGSSLYKFNCSFSTGVWYLFTWTFNPLAAAGSKTAFYINGVAQTINTYTEGSGGNWGTGSLRVNITGYYHPNCTYDCVKHFDYTLAPSEVLLLMPERGGMNDQVGSV